MPREAEEQSCHPHLLRRGEPGGPSTPSQHRAVPSDRTAQLGGNVSAQVGSRQVARRAPPRPPRGVRAAEMHLDPGTKGLPSENSPPRAERRRRRSAPGREGAPPGEPTGACPRGAKPTTGTAGQSAVRASAIRAPPAAAASPQGGPRGTRAPPRARVGRGRVRLGRRNTGRKARAGGPGGGGGEPTAIGPALARPPAPRTSLAPPPCA